MTGLDEDDPNEAPAARAVTSANAGLLWQVLQEPDLRDFQDLPDLNRAQFLRVVGSRPTRIVPASSAFRMVAVVLAARASRWVGFVADSRIEPRDGRGWIQRGARTSRPRHRQRSRCCAGRRRLSPRSLREIRAYCLAENVASRAVLRHAGFEDEGTCRAVRRSKESRLTSLRIRSSATAGPRCSVRIRRPLDRNARVMEAGAALRDSSKKGLRVPWGRTGVDGPTAWRDREAFLRVTFESERRS